MPSLHVTWAGVTALGLALLSARAWVRVLGAAHVAVTIAVVLATGHHFVLDTLAGLAVVAGVIVLGRVLPARSTPARPGGLVPARSGVASGVSPV